MGAYIMKNGVAYGAQVDAYTKTQTDALLGEKVDKESGKGLSTNDYTTAEKDKLSGIESEAQKNVQPDWSATSGDSAIQNKPTTLSGYGIADAYTKAEIDAELNGKQDALTFDATPTNGSINPVTSGGVYESVSAISQSFERYSMLTELLDSNFEPLLDSNNNQLVGTTIVLIPT